MDEHLITAQNRIRELVTEYRLLKYLEKMLQDKEQENPDAIILILKESITILKELNEIEKHYNISPE